MTAHNSLSVHEAVRLQKYYECFAEFAWTTPRCSLYKSEITCEAKGAALQGTKTKSPEEKQFPAETVTPQTQVTPRHYANVPNRVCSVCCGPPIPIIWFEFGIEFDPLLLTYRRQWQIPHFKGHCVQVNRYTSLDVLY